MTRKLLNRYFAEMGEDGGDGGDSSSGSGAIGTGNDARIALLNAIGDSADDLRAEDLADINDDGSTSEFQVQRPDGELEDLAEPAPKDTTKPEVTEPDPLDTAQMITRKVNGKMVTKPLEEWLVDAQKVNSADEYLQDAARIRKELRVEPEAQRTEPEQPRITPDQSAAQRREELRQRVRAIQMGTEDEAIAAMEALQNMNRTPTLTVEDVGRVADERLKFNTALAEFNKEYADLVSNPQLHRMVLEADATLIRNKDTRPYAERYKEVGDAVRAWRDNLIQSVAPVPTEPTPSKVATLEDRRAAKAAAPQAPKAASKVAAPRVEETEDEDASSVIAGMAKARGGPQWMQGRQG